MLVLSRKCGEEIVIADNIRVTVLQVHGGRVKLGFSAPGDTPIHRAEVYQQLMLNASVGAYADSALA